MDLFMVDESELKRSKNMNNGKIVSRTTPLPTRRKPSGSKGGMILVPLVATVIFITLLQVFDPTANDASRNDSTRQINSGSAVHDSLAGFANRPLPANTASHEKEAIQVAASEKQEIIKLLGTAGVPLSALTIQEIQKLPKWSHITELYGEGIVVLGKDRCEEFRKTVRQHDRILGVAGMFNTGTNLLEIHLFKNVAKTKSIWQVPWGKHRMASVKWNHTANNFEEHDKKHVLPIVIVRDPYAWFQSMCKSPYNARWRHGIHHCPNLVPSKEDFLHFNHLHEAFTVNVVFDANQRNSFDSLAHLWSTWYREYLEADYPRLIIRFEDLVFQPEAVLQEIAQCVGGTVRSPVRFVLSSSKSHGAGTDYVSAVIKTGDSSGRLRNMTAKDLAFSQEHLDDELMQLFHYHQ